MSADAEMSRHVVVGPLTYGADRRAIAVALAADCDGAVHRLTLARHVDRPVRSAQRGHGPNGRVYLDAAWDDVGLVVEFDGGHHALALNPIDDALRQNDRVAKGENVIRIPALGLRLAPGEFMRQVCRTYDRLRPR